MESLTSPWTQNGKMLDLSRMKNFNMKTIDFVTLEDILQFGGAYSREPWRFRL